MFEASSTHDDVGNRVSKTISGLMESYAYDAGDRLRSVTRAGATPKEWGFDFDAVGNRTAERVDRITRTYTHDAWNRMLGAQTSGAIRASPAARPNRPR